jgi:hypothetical protein
MSQVRIENTKSDESLIQFMYLKKKNINKIILNIFEQFLIFKI